MPKLSKRVNEWLTDFGMSPKEIQANLNAEADEVRQIVEQKFTDVINGDLGVHAGVAGSLKSYKPVSKKIIQSSLEAGVIYNTYDITVESEQHKSIVSNGYALNVFELIDTGRKALKPIRKGSKKRYLMWSFTGEHTIAYKPKGRGLRNKKTGKFGLTTGSGAVSQTPIRHEPRMKKNPYVDRSEYGGPLGSTPFFATHADAVAPKNLYQRIYDSAKKEIKRRKLIYDIVLVKGKR